MEIEHFFEEREKSYGKGTDKTLLYNICTMYDGIPPSPAKEKCSNSKFVLFFKRPENTIKHSTLTSNLLKNGQYTLK